MKSCNSIISVTLSIALVLLSINLFGTSIADAGEYDGLWFNFSIPEVTDVAVVRHDGENIVIVFLALSGDDWDAFYGPISGNSATVTTLLSGIDLNASVEFIYTSQMVLTVISCSPSESCPPAGAKISFEKIF